jgi:hypothetical protein
MTHRENQGLTRRYTFLQVGERKEVGQVRMPRWLSTSEHVMAHEEVRERPESNPQRYSG